MKVSGSNSVDPKTLQNANDVKSASKGNLSKTDSKNVGEAGAAAAGAKLSLSPKARDFQKIKGIADNSDGVDQAKVDRIKTALKDGKFEVDYDRVAEKIVEHDLMYELLA